MKQLAGNRASTLLFLNIYYFLIKNKLKSDKYFEKKQVYKKVSLLTGVGFPAVSRQAGTPKGASSASVSALVSPRILYLSGSGSRVHSARVRGQTRHLSSGQSMVLVYSETDYDQNHIRTQNRR
jgi:hypothetical protein